LAWTLREEKYTLAFALGLLLCTFKEYFPFCLGLLGFFLVIKKRAKAGWGMVVGSAIWAIFDFKLRSLVFGEADNYGNGLFAGLTADPPQFLFRKLMGFDWRGVVFAIFPTVLAAGICAWKEKKRDWIHALLLFMAPILAIQFLFGTLGFHYGAPIYAVLISIIAFSNGDWLGDFKTISKPVQIFLWITLIYAGADSVLRTRTLIPMLKEEDKPLALEKVREVLKSEPSDSRIIASLGIIGAIIQPDRKYFSFSSYSKAQQEYEVIALGAFERFYSWPLNPEDIAGIKERCRPFAKEVFLDDSMIFFARGKFPRSCISGESGS
jgi:hypothetical protein